MQGQVIGGMCVSKLPAREWKLDNGTEGTTYKVEISDGTGSVRLKCLDEDIYNKFEVFKRFNIALDITPFSIEGYSGIKAVIVFCEEYEDGAVNK